MDTLHQQKQQSWQMFNTISKRYDITNTVISFGLHKWWKRILVKQVAGAVGTRHDVHLLDIASGTGDIAIQLAKRIPQAAIVAFDPSEGMLDIAKEKIEQAGLNNTITTTVGSAEELPYEDSSQDAITISFGIRNVAGMNTALQECYRVLTPGGVLAILEFSQPRSSVVRFGYRMYNKFVLPVVANLVTGHKAAYNYLDTTIAEFPSGEEFGKHLEQAGFSTIQYQPLNFGVCTIYIGYK